RLGCDRFTLILGLRDLQRVRALHERVDTPIAVVDVDGRVAGRYGNRQPGAGARPVDENAITVPDLRDQLGHAFGVRSGPRIEARLVAAQQLVDTRGIGELLQLQIEQLADLVAGGNVCRRARDQGDRREA